MIDVSEQISPKTDLYWLVCPVNINSYKFAIVEKIHKRYHFFSDPVLIYLFYMTPEFKLDNDIGISCVVIFLTSSQWNNSLQFTYFEHNVTTRQTWTWTHSNFGISPWRHTSVIWRLKSPATRQCPRFDVAIREKENRKIENGAY